jgi:hypothetical protein
VENAAAKHGDRDALVELRVEVTFEDLPSSFSNTIAHRRAPRVLSQMPCTEREWIMAVGSQNTTVHMTIGAIDPAPTFGIVSYEPREESLWVTPFDDEARQQTTEVGGRHPKASHLEDVCDQLMHTAGPGTVACSKSA